MGKRTARVFYELSTFVLLLYSVQVSCASTSQIIVDVMKNDPEICESSAFLYNSNITKSCASLEYPKDNLSFNYRNVDALFCLGVYDSAYKICQYSKRWKVPYNDSTTFSSYIQKFFPPKEEADKTKFCQKVTNIMAMYEKTKYQVSLLLKHLNDFRACYALCFNFDEEFNPLCAILAWIKSVDEEVKAAPIILQPASQVSDTIVGGNINSERTKSSQGTESDKITKATTTGGSNNDMGKTLKPKPLSNDNNGDSKTQIIRTEQDEASVKKEPVAAPQTVPQSTNNKTKIPPEPQEVQAIHSNNQGTINNAPVVPSNPQETISDDNESQHVTKANTQVVPKNPAESVTNTEKGETKKTANDEIKTSTLSEDTQDDANQEDYNHLDNEQLPYDPDDNPDQPIDTGDQNQNMPEPSEQRDIVSRYHGMRSDDESHFFTYFTVVSLICIAAYIGYHNKQKILAIVLEGRRSRNNRGRRRPSTASYRKLDCTLEEAVTSQCNANVTHVIY